MAQRFLSNIKVNDAYTLPASDGTNGQVISTDGAGTLTFADAAASDAIEITVKNVSGGSLAIGTVITPSPSANPPGGNVLEVIAAGNSAASTMPAIGVLKAALADDAEGSAIAFGQVSGFDTSSFTAGDSIYVNSSGGFTATKPTGTALIQKIGIVVKSHASNGSIKVFGANRTNDVPNIAEDYLWLGNSSGVATATEHLLNNVKDVTTSSPTDGQVLTWDNANSYWKNADASGGGGGGGTITIEKNISGTSPTEATNGTRTAFTISSDVENENDLQVYINGVYQSKDTFSVSGSTVTLTTAPPTATEVEFIHIKAISGIITVDRFSGDGSDTTFDLTLSNSNENHTQVYIDGVYQSKDNYSVSGKTITFSTAPPNNTDVEVVHLKAVDASSLNMNNFTGNGTQTAFTLSESISDENKTFVFVQGVYQEKSNYSVSGTTLTFLTAPPNGFSVEVISFGSISITTVGNANDAKYTPNLISSATTAIAGNLYVFTASTTLTLPASPSNGDTVKISNRSGVGTCVIARNSEKIMGTAEDMTIDYNNARFELIYTGSAQGWVLI